MSNIYSISSRYDDMSEGELEQALSQFKSAFEELDESDKALRNELLDVISLMTLSLVSKKIFKKKERK